jgi:hypothetical protein
MIELLLPCGFDTQEYSWVKGTIGICMPADSSVYKKHQDSSGTQEWPNKNERYLTTDVYLEYDEVHRYERIPDSHWDIFRNSH